MLYGLFTYMNVNNSYNFFDSLFFTHHIKNVSKDSIIQNNRFWFDRLLFGSCKKYPQSCSYINYKDQNAEHLSKEKVYAKS